MVTNCWIGAQFIEYSFLATTRDKAVFPFFPDRFCNGFEQVLQRYNEITPNVSQTTLNWN